jgi:hypothetical protein
LAAAVALLVALVSSVVASPASGQQDPRQQRDEVRKQKAAAAADIDALRADDATVQRALADLQTNITGLQGEVDDARTAEAQASAAAAEARQREADMQQRIDQLKAQLRDVAVQAYIEGGVEAQSLGDTTSGGLDDLIRSSYLRQEANRHVTLGDQLRAAEEDLALARQDAEKSAALAAQKRTEIEQRLADVTAARQQQVAFAQQVEARLDQRLSEAANLATLDQKLSDQITAQEAALAARVPKGISSAGSGGPSGSIPLTTVRGITVASSIADQLERMLAAAQADGLTFGGSGYRDSSSQWALRQRNCPDPANSPPSACHPPTARPGASMHERGLAIDFSYDGAVISSHDNPGYQWLAANAGRFGFANLPSEPWHWSVNGQ